MMQRKINNICLLIALFSLIGLYGCAAVVVGIGAASAGAAAYLNGKLIKTYEAEYHETVRASSTTLEQLKIPVSETLADELKTVIKAQRPDGSPVQIEVVRIEPNQTQVAVRTGSLGFWDRRVSEQIHGYINEALGGKMIADQNQKPPDNLASESDQPVTDEMTEAEIIEEELAENLPLAAVDSKDAPETGGGALENKPMETAQMLAESIFVIFFDQDTNELSPRAVKKLDRLYEILEQNSRAEIIINGYSDSTGSMAYNEMISEIRANAVKSYLIAKGIAPFRMKTFGNGPQKFIGSNRTEEGRKLNRRAEIEVINPYQ